MPNLEILEQAAQVTYKQDVTKPRIMAVPAARIYVDGQWKANAIRRAQLARRQKSCGRDVWGNLI